MFEGESTDNGGDTGVWFRNGKFKDIARKFLKKANKFVDHMGENGENNEDGRDHYRHHRGGHYRHHGEGHEERHGEGHGEGHGYGHGHCRGGRKDWGFCGERSKWAEKRAVIVRKPEEVLVCEPGKIIFVEVEVLNETKWPWKFGCFVGIA